MSRAGQRFKQSDVTKAVRAAVKAGMSVGRVEMSADGRIVIVAGKPGEDVATDEVTTTAPSLADDLDRELAEFAASHGQD
jgi:hypothetical protein